MNNYIHILKTHISNHKINIKLLKKWADFVNSMVCVCMVTDTQRTVEGAVANRCSLMACWPLTLWALYKQVRTEFKREFLFTVVPKLIECQFSVIFENSFSFLELQIATFKILTLKTSFSLFLMSTVVKWGQTREPLSHWLHVNLIKVHSASNPSSVLSMCVLCSREAH